MLPFDKMLFIIIANPNADLVKQIMEQVFCRAF